MISFLNASEYDRSNNAAQKALKDLDCEFEDCHKEQPKPKVIIKERVVVKKVTVPKPVYVPIVIKQQAPKTQQKENKTQIADANIVYNKAFFDMYPRSQAPILDYITFDKRNSFDINQFVDSVSRIKEKNLDVVIYGRLEVPKSIRTSEVYIDSGKKYRYIGCCNDWTKKIYYNDATTEQNSDYFLVKVQKDANNKRYVKYKIKIHLYKPWLITPAERNVAPNQFFFKMAPKVRGYKDKFVPVKVYIIEE